MDRLEKLRKPLLSMEPSELMELVTFIRADRQKPKRDPPKVRSKVATRTPKPVKAAPGFRTTSRVESRRPPAEKTTSLLDQMNPAERDKLLKEYGG